MNTLKERIISRLTDLDMKRADLARTAGLSRRASVSNIINGKTKKMSSETLFLIAGALKCNPGWLRDGKGPQDMQLMQPSESRTIEMFRPLISVWLVQIPRSLSMQLRRTCARSTCIQSKSASPSRLASCASSVTVERQRKRPSKKLRLGLAPWRGRPRNRHW